VAAPIQTIERLAELPELREAVPSKRMLVIVNPYAATVSDRLRNLVLYALEGRYQVDAVDTQSPGHASEICREAAHEGYDVVVAFGGDGTVNEAVNGLVGSGTPLSCLPGGSTNVYCRLLGIPREIVDATEHLLRMADDWHPRRVDVGRVNGRRFAFSAGLGLDASVVRRVDAHPRLKARLGAYYFTYVAVGTFSRRYLLRPPRLVASVPNPQGDLEQVSGVTAIVQNAAPFTYFLGRRIDIAEGATLEGGTLSGAVLGRASPIDMPTMVWRIFSRRARLTRHRQITSFEGVTAVDVASVDGRPLPLQVDGDFIGEVSTARFGVEPLRLTVVS
jgi:diacylglycerol kinase family enzyme